MKASLEPWIVAGYRIFAYEGPLGLKVERLARTVGKNKSSFYHHFADLEVFTEELLGYHLAQARLVAEKEGAAADLEELITVLVDHKVDMLFNRQLRIHRTNPAFEACFNRVNEFSVPAITPLWARLLGLEDKLYLAGLVLQLSLENFFLQITDETLRPEWLRAYFHRARQLVLAFQSTGSTAPLNGPV